MHMAAKEKMLESQTGLIRPNRDFGRWWLGCLIVGVILGLSFPLPAQQQGHTTDEYRQYFSQYTRPDSIPFPEDNHYTQERERLGRLLFFDPRLSGSQQMSCATCHNPGLSWQDGLPKAIGHGMQTLSRRTPTIWNLAWAPALFWDGRAESLEEQALGPITSPQEMNMRLPTLMKKLQAISGYRALFAWAYPGEGISGKTVGKALATFERTLVSGPAPFDSWVAGNTDAISPAAKRGFLLFNTKAQCAQCHTSWRFTDDSFHDTGLPGEDRGRGQFLPDIETAQFLFKTPTLRNVTQRAPYMHDGSLATLEEVIALYDTGGSVQRPSLSDHIKPLSLSSQDKHDLIAFLSALTSTERLVTLPNLPQ